MADTPGGMVPVGFNQDSIAQYYKSLIAPIDQETAGRAGAARTDAAARGLEGTATETGGVAAENYYGGLRKDSAASGLAMNLAGLVHGDAQDKIQRDWQGNENELSRDNERILARMGYDFKGRQDEVNYRHGYQGQIAKFGMNLAGMTAGSFL